MPVLQLGEALLQQQARPAARWSRKPGASTTSSTALPTAMASGLPPKVVPCVPTRHALGGLAVARQAPSGKPPPMPLAIAMMSGVTPGPLVGEELAGAADAGLHLVEDQQQAVLVAELRASAQAAARRNGRMPPSPWIGSIRIAPVSGPIAAFERLEVAERHLVEAFDLGAEAFEVFLLAAGRDGRQRAAVEGALEGDDAEALGMAARRLVLARHLDRGLVAPRRRNW